jgi:hypothetical protein
MNKLKILVLVLLPVLFFECKKWKKYKIEGTIFEDCTKVAANTKFEIILRDSYYEHHRDVHNETTTLGEFTTDNNGHFETTIKGFTEYYSSELFIFSGANGYFKLPLSANKNVTNANFYETKSFPISIQLAPSAPLTINDTLYYSINYYSIKKIVGPFSYQNISDTINGFTAKTDIKWAVGWSDFNSANAKTATISLPADCGSATSCEMIFP